MVVEWAQKEPNISNMTSHASLSCYHQHYPKPFEDVIRKEFPDFLTEKEDRRKQKLAYLRRRGKGPPKKGQGKRALKGIKKK
jgi:hypothetical protein